MVLEDPTLDLLVKMPPEAWPHSGILILTGGVITNFDVIFPLKFIRNGYFKAKFK